ncbi:hypothetical protein PoB_005111600 [Plakobranchus ocellatus]|uniref:Uncharacterized protein n=1 Tax=Plakobranchus ocellatus TaxID=259542 RepID=A0AAV4BMV0_9GAST|nr:hypothetical protein PoB_005111600 [Plakobranchus ocellatus]
MDSNFSHCCHLCLETLQIKLDKHYVFVNAPDLDNAGKKSRTFVTTDPEYSKRPNVVARACHVRSSGRGLVVESRPDSGSFYQGGCDTAAAPGDRSLGGSAPGRS